MNSKGSKTESSDCDLSIAGRSERGSPELRLLLPTYVGRRNSVLGMDSDDFGNPYIPVLVHLAEGLRIVLGSQSYEDFDAPDIQIERRPNGWAIFLHPLGGGDPSGCVYFLDHGRSYLLKENSFSTNAIVVLDSNEEPREVDDLAPPDACDSARMSAPASAGRTVCARCGQLTARRGDWFGDLCPGCADRTEGRWSCDVCGRFGDFEAMGGNGKINPACCGFPCSRDDIDK